MDVQQTNSKGTTQKPLPLAYRKLQFSPGAQRLCNPALFFQLLLLTLFPMPVPTAIPRKWHAELHLLLNLWLRCSLPFLFPLDAIKCQLLQLCRQIRLALHCCPSILYTCSGNTNQPRLMMLRAECVLFTTMSPTLGVLHPLCLLKD